MNRYRLQSAPRWYPPKLNPFLVRLLEPFRRRERIKKQHLVSVDISGLDQLKRVIASGAGVLITPNHSSHADPDAMYEVSRQVGSPFYFMAAWQVFDQQRALGRLFLQTHGVFSVDREGVDVQAFKQAVKILEEARYPLVIFPEGEVYHCNGRLTPFRDGAAAIALAAAKRAKNNVVCVPCALNYRYVKDPTPELSYLMDELERRVLWRPAADLAIEKRIYRFAAALLSLKEIEYAGEAQTGQLAERERALSETILQQLELHYGVPEIAGIVPERVKELRRRILSLLEEKAPGSADYVRLLGHLDDIFFVTQLFSYPGDYVAERPSVERIAETLDKFEEDVLGRASAVVRGERSVQIVFGEPLPVERAAKNKTAAIRELTAALEKRVQAMLMQ
ncbi:MAG TPA: 1-acyl-sn-glycerol-3-phosphate acyltransferase [Oligoflexia bacterium]|mgnify:CR=1 FL=1|nr:1-acyl-sn-glycerol-3-phosphate acyltransferase [Oligoflexia bacterium]